MRKDLFTEIQAKFEANRCLMCADAPCSCGIAPRRDRCACLHQEDTIRQSRRRPQASQELQCAFCFLRLHMSDRFLMRG